MNKSLLLLMLAGSVGCGSEAADQRYRGDYTLGHEVNTFCPEISSQCYWLSPKTDKQTRNQLKQIYQERSPDLYKPVCVIIAGDIDKDSKRTGFAVDMDGLITITRVYGTCDTSQKVTHGDLRHHRWVLTTIDDIPVNTEDWSVLPVLDFGEHLFVEGSDGCRKFNGFARLTGDQLVFNELKFNNDHCKTGRSSAGLLSISGAWRIRIEDSRHLILRRAGSTMIFTRDDWR